MGRFANLEELGHHNNGQNSPFVQLGCHCDDKVVAVKNEETPPLLQWWGLSS